MTINQTNHEKSKSVHIRLICSIRVLLTMNGTRIKRMFTDENNKPYFTIRQLLCSRRIYCDSIVFRYQLYYIAEYLKDTIHQVRNSEIVRMRILILCSNFYPVTPTKNQKQLRDTNFQQS